MRAVSHPVRLSLLEALAIRGPLTATQASALIDESPTTCSFHLRQLAKYGLVEEAGGGPGRNRPWRVVRVGFVIDPQPGDVAGQLASRALASVALARQVARHESSVRSSDGFPEQWRDAAWQHEMVWWVTPDELSEIEAQIDELVQRYVHRLIDPADRPDGAVPVEFVTFGHVFAELAGFDDTSDASDSEEQR
jgi:DNA-binding transcriptional ArsR family regulator